MPLQRVLYKAQRHLRQPDRLAGQHEVHIGKGADEGEEDQVRYEKEYKKYQGMPQPHYTDIAYTIDLDPEARAISVEAPAPAGA